jgi:hypothetical protein
MFEAFGICKDLQRDEKSDMEVDNMESQDTSGMYGPERVIGGQTSVEYAVNCSLTSAR